jgi:hypothetical protein
MIANDVSRVISKAVFPLAMFIRQIHWQQQHATVTILLALATLGSRTQRGSFLLAKDCHFCVLLEMIFKTIKYDDRKRCL